MNELKLYEFQRMDKSEIEELKRLPTYPFVKNGNMITLISKKKGVYFATAISRYFYVEKIVRNLETGSFSDVININTLMGCQSVTADRSIFCPRRFEEINANGLVFDSKAINFLIRYVNISEQQAPTITEYQSVGWVQDKNGELAFYGLEDDEHLKYMGGKDLSTNGSFQTYRDKANEIVIGRTGLEIALLTSLSAAVIGLIATATKRPIESLLVHFYGNSSFGKTTALQLAASVWGNPAMGKGLLSSWNATDNAVLGKLDLNYGIAQCFDESSAIKRDFSTLLYAISQNTSKSRLSKESHLKSVKKFCTAILSSGENSLLKASNQNLGLRVRVLEFFNVKLTDDANHSNELQAFVAENHGAVGAEFVRALSGIDLNSLLQTLSFWRDSLLSKIKLKTSVTERLVGKYAIILATADIARQFLGLNVDVEKIQSFFLEHHKAIANEANIGKRAYSCILDWLAKNRGKLLPETRKESDAPVEGVFLKGHRIALLSSTFEKIISDNGFTDVSVVAHELKKLGILKPESKDKLKARVVVNGIKQNCYRLVIKELTDFEPLEFQNTVSDDEISF